MNHSRSYLRNVAKYCAFGIVLNLIVLFLAAFDDAPTFVLVAAGAMCIILFVVIIVIDGRVGLIEDEISNISWDEHVVGIASRDETEVVWQSTPTGRTYEAIERRAWELAGFPRHMSFERGFFTSRERFVCGETAMVIAKRRQQLGEWKDLNREILTPEMLGFD